MNSYLIDTNVVSELARPRPAPSVIAFLQREADLWLSVVTLHELAYGAERVADASHRAKLLGWCANIAARFAPRVLSIEREDAAAAGRLRALAESQGRPADPLDAMVAAAALSRGLILATRNTKDFVAFGVTLVNPWDQGAS